MRLKTLLEDESAAIRWAQTNCNNYTGEFWMQDGKVHLNGSISFSPKYALKSFPYKWGEVTGDLIVSMTGFSSFENFPTVIGDKLVLNDMERLTSLKDIHKHIEEVGMIYFNGTTITKNILGLAMIDVERINFKNGGSSEMKRAFSIMEKYLGKGKAGVLGAQEELIDAGLDDFAEL